MQQPKTMVEETPQQPNQTAKETPVPQPKITEEAVENSAATFGCSEEVTATPVDLKRRNWKSLGFSLFLFLGVILGSPEQVRI